ncbi:MAG: excinuclease ABC subunit UvrA [Rhodothermaceae bacterium]|nr:excinuclease ABC subunit UvrA [Rhodothermaceae bacterium]MXW33073.1 excinuclease ABC subunit UvrA [Rhodothermaceae bacterium]MXX98019.1 excinuclease ABC subunit UvrA [Rhodothermaceae bacterium]MXZ17236.1 excinuclease ABC subunit UvrA [Rhodothermaceae bacterium]MXZ57802.1 excinuclease ABC subunit UvrA [Rhodothermaceae bacterium]
MDGLQHEGGTEYIVVRGARVHNLQSIDVDIPRDALVVVTGLSGSGKSSLAFDTIYSEGQRRYMESLSAYARQFVGMPERPDVDHIEGLSPVISIDQKTVSRNPRSTVGTITEVYDFLRLLYARAATSFSAKSGKPLVRQSTDEIIEAVQAYSVGAKIEILAPVVKDRKGHYRELFERVSRQGYVKVRIDGKIRDITLGMQVARYKVHTIEVVVDRLLIEEGMDDRIAASVKTALGLGEGVLIIAEQEKKDRIFSRYLYDPETGKSFQEAAPKTFSFNAPSSACKMCNGLGVCETWDASMLVPYPSTSLQGGAVEFLDPWIHSMFFTGAEKILKKHGYKLTTPVEDISKTAWDEVLHGAPDGVIRGSASRFVLARGLFVELDQIYKWASRKEQTKMEVYRTNQTCPSCNGGRLSKEALSYRISGKTISDLAQMNLIRLREFLDTVSFSRRQAQIAVPIIKEVQERLSFMIDVGVGYLTLDRPAVTLSGGESQRIRLATQIGTQLTGVLYVLDEPSIGLHARDNRRLIASLRRLRDLGNSVLVVEHDRDMIEAADHLIDLGPGAGDQGGKVVCSGPPNALSQNGSDVKGLTLPYLTGERCIEIPKQRRKVDKRKAVVLTGATGNNLKNVTLKLPVSAFICVTGVSGSGKSSLINQTLVPALNELFSDRIESKALPHERLSGLQHIDKVVNINQKPIGRTPRSNPATYITLFTAIRELFASLPLAQARGYKPGRFSFNVSGGRCESCSGAGVERLEMSFLSDVYLECETCQGRRYNQDTLEVFYKGKTISEILDMRVTEAAAFFANVPKIARKLDTLLSVGLGYIRLGQPSTTISGGEAQRVKLAKELSRIGRGNTLYLFDEPTTGLHFEDIRLLLDVLQKLVDKGNTVLVIEHNPDVIKVADYIVDMGPEGGEEGGRILFAGTPEEMSRQKTYTGELLREILPERRKK